ncbi:MAG: hypothetical protein V4671_04365 [Armatimonadota bacterium]
MSEFPGERQEREEPEAGELAAEYRAMPLRIIEALETERKVALLDCGHRKALLVWLRVGDSVRCRDCYDSQMQKARQMIEGPG